MKSWICVRVDFPADSEEQILAALYEAGTLGVQVLDADLPPVEPLVEPAPSRRSRRDAVAGGATEAHEASLRGSGPSRAVATDGRSALAWFPETCDLRAALESLESLSGSAPGSLRLSKVAEEPWVERQGAGRAAIAIGHRFQIVPDAAVRTQVSDGRAIILEIPAKRAFGTGEHATTRLCLELEESIPLAGRTVLDFGTGSGILALAAAALGASEVLGVDIDPEAIEMASENLRLNFEVAGAGTVRFVVGGLEAASGPFDLVVGNIFAPVLVRSAGRLSALQSVGGHAILSGFSSEEGDEVARAFAGEGYAEVRRHHEEDWTALLLRRQSRHGGESPTGPSGAPHDGPAG